MRRLFLSWFGALAATLVLAAPAASQNDPQVDPGSPAGTEYQLPIDRAREQAGGDGSSGSSGSTAGEAPLFGEGVEDEKSGSGRKSGSSSGGGSGSSTSTTPSEQPDPGTSTPETVRAQAPAPDGAGGGALPIGGIAAGVLLIGALAGLALRRRSQGADSTT